MRIAVAGANGFVGRHLTHYLSNQGINVVALDRRELTMGRLSAAVEGCAALVNCAGNKDGRGPDAKDANVLLPLRLLDAAISRNIPSMVHVSSVAAVTSVTAPGQTVDDGYSGLPTGAYGLSKREGDDALQQAARQRGFEGLTILRPPILIGSDAGGVFALLRSMAKAGVPLPLAGATNRRSFMHVDNFAATILAAVTARCDGAYIVTDSPPLSTADLYSQMLSAAGHGGRIFSVGGPGRALLRKALGSRGESLFGSAAFSGDRFATAACVTWPVPPPTIIERAMRVD